MVAGDEEEEPNLKDHLGTGDKYDKMYKAVDRMMSFVYRCAKETEPANGWRTTRPPIPLPAWITRMTVTSSRQPNGRVRLQKGCDEVFQYPLSDRLLPVYRL